MGGSKGRTHELSRYQHEEVQHHRRPVRSSVANVPTSVDEYPPVPGSVRTPDSEMVPVTGRRAPALSSTVSVSSTGTPESAGYSRFRLYVMNADESADLDG
jgi:hypothetical protein